MDNPNSIFEYPRAEAFRSDNAWVHDSVGKAVKVDLTLAAFLPSDLQYRIVFMRRNVREISLSRANAPSSGDTSWQRFGAN